MQRSTSLWDIFINHCGADTKKNVAGLLHDQLMARQGFKAFLDNRIIKPGDKLFKKIDEAIDGCKVGVVVLSPRFCHSYFCLYELARLVEAKKRLVLIFFDIQPSEIKVMLDSARHSARDLYRFASALTKAKFTVDITFDSSKGDWSELVRNASNIVHRNLMEVMEKESRMSRL